MLYTIQNEELSMEVSSLGAQMMSLKAKDGTEYLWQGDSTYWEDRAPVLFPFIARLTKDTYSYQGRIYPMGIHGFAMTSEFALGEQTDTSITLVLKDNDKTREQYPFAFTFRITFALEGKCLKTICQVENRNDAIMPFAIGGHPGFNVPLCEGEGFEDYVLEFSQPCNPDRIGFTPALYVSGHQSRYFLEDGKTISLNHDMFDGDAIVLKNMAKEVTLRSRVSGKGVRVSYPDMPYVGFWHWPRTDAPYVCIEPWSSLPSRQDVVEEFTCKSDMIQLAPGGTYRTRWDITVLKGHC